MIDHTLRMVGKSHKRTGERHLLFSHTDRLSKAERIVLLTFVGAAAVFDIVAMIRDPGGDMPYRSLSLLTTLTLALFAWSPLVATVALGVVVATAFALGVPTYVLMGASIASLLVTRLASTPLLLGFVAGVASCTLALISRVETPTGDIVAFLTVVLIAGIVGAGLRFALDQSSRLETRLVAQAEHERKAIQAERSWIAGELHDSIAHHLTIISLHSQLLDDEQMRPVSQEAIEDAARKALSDLRFIINISEDSPGGENVPKGDLAEAITEAKRELQAAGQIVVIDGDSADKSIPRGIEIILARMVRESTTNIIKYSGPGEVKFALDVRPNLISMEIRNPLSFAAARVNSSSGTGVSRMSERVLSQRGDFRAGVVGNDWVVFARLPIISPGDETATNPPTDGNRLKKMDSRDGAPYGAAASSPRMEP